MFKKSSSKKERNNSITVHTIPLDQTYIRSDGRKRLPWLGRHVGKFLRKQSSRVKKKPSFFRRFKNRTVDVTQSFSIPSNSSSPKISSSPRRSESMKDRMSRPWRKGGATPRRKQTPVSPLARSTSPVALSSVMTPNSSPPGSIQNLNSTTPPNSPPTTHKERHSMFAESSLLTHQKSVSSSELFLSTTKKNTSPQTSPLLKRAVSPSPDQQHKVHKSRWSNTLERSTMPRAKKTTGSNSVSFIM